MYRFFSDRYGCIWFGNYIEALDSLLNLSPDIIRKYSSLSFSKEYALKRFKSQRFNQYIRKSFQSQAKKEFKNTQILNSIGIKTPKVYLYAVNYNPFCEYESMLLMQRVEHLGTMADLFKRGIEGYSRQVMLNNFMRDIRVFIDNGYYHKDAHFNNVLVTKDYQTIWIDNSIGIIKSDSDRERMVSKFIKRPFLTDIEKNSLRDII